MSRLAAPKAWMLDKLGGEEDILGLRECVGAGGS
jgi:hypothetical protein